MEAESNSSPLLGSSSYFAYYFFKFAAAMVFLTGIIGLHALAFPDSTFVEPPPKDLPPVQLVWLIFVLLLCFYIAKFMFFRICVIRYDNRNIEINKSGESRIVPWEDVRNVSKVPTAAPPLYRMTFKDGSEPAYFVMSMFFYVYVIFWSWDFTGFYGYAKERIARSQGTDD